jgi:uncharacterized protein YjiS (DUF1127 family)
MAALDHFSASFGTVRATIVARVLNAAVAALRAWKNRREVYRLGEMSDWELADIGLTRAALPIAVRSPLGVDPTAYLGSVADARAFAAEAAARRVC